MVEFPDGSNLFINPLDGEGRCCPSQTTGRCVLEKSQCGWLKRCKCEGGPIGLTEYAIY